MRGGIDWGALGALWTTVVTVVHAIHTPALSQ